MSNHGGLWSERSEAAPGGLRWMEVPVVEKSVTEGWSRREFLIGSGGFAAGAAVGSVLGGGWLSPSAAQAAETKAPAWPWPYVKLDAEKGRKMAAELYFQGG